MEFSGNNRQSMMFEDEDYSELFLYVLGLRIGCISIISA